MDDGQVTAIRFVSSIDSDRYQSIGFIISGTYGDRTITNKQREITHLYRTIKAVNETVKPSVFSDESKYFFAYTVRELQELSTWNVRPFYVTLDGTKVVGKAGDYAK